MTTHTLGLHFIEGHLFGDKKSRVEASAWVCLKSYSVINDGTNVIAHDCLSSGEMDACIDQLHAELEEIRKSARRKFAAVQRKNKKLKQAP